MINLDQILAEIDHIVDDKYTQYGLPCEVTEDYESIRIDAIKYILEGKSAAQIAQLIFENWDPTPQTAYDYFH
jgi:hypothetical protein